jgi:hypothetical protein
MLQPNSKKRKLLSWLLYLQLVVEIHASSSIFILWSICWPFDYTMSRTLYAVQALYVVFQELIYVTCYLYVSSVCSMISQVWLNWRLEGSCTFWVLYFSKQMVRYHVLMLSGIYLLLLQLVFITMPYLAIYTLQWWHNIVTLNSLLPIYKVNPIALKNSLSHDWSEDVFLLVLLLNIVSETWELSISASSLAYFTTRIVLNCS